MAFNEELTLTRDTPATLIPAGDEVSLEAGTRVLVSQALGGTVTVRTERGLFRIAGKDLDALGPEAEAAARGLAEEEVASPADAPFAEEQVWTAMKQCFDPEIPVNIVDLGLVYDLQISPVEDGARHDVRVKMTLTAQGCGMGPVIANDAKDRIEALPRVRAASVEIVWDPPWTPHMISEEGREKLGLE